ncbi:thioredoxin family protein [Hymenobacter properus]|uniref:Thioredoxin family protein n=1 Tax=Hymenobacter properus TaxID=2791026 RepID=A0A931BDU7_9BACT|nr:thioredoxin family protein [Hymenobacter properus]MBF9141999.1 thioredoxin family protein [Hymenobacter properus]MBR7720806.1 thioredoxin family protein [Microvirga sp. SRT04]
MSINPFSAPTRVLILGLALSAGPALAQKTTIKAKDDKVKTKTTAADGSTSKTKTVATAAPQPVSPAASAPQTVLPAATAPAQGLAGSEGWVSDLGAAQAQAKATNRPILAVFSGSDWCKPCIMYEQEVFAKPEFAAYAKDKLVLAHFDFPRMKKNQPSAAQLKLNEAAAAQLNREGEFPLAVVISPEGKVLAKTGYIAGGPAAFEAYLKTVVPTL